MPYITKLERAQFDLAATGLGVGAQNKGHLAYIFYKISVEYMRKMSKTYSNKSDVKAALHDAMMEWQRQVIDPHEDKKIKENGSIE